MNEMATLQLYTTPGASRLHSTNTETLSTYRNSKKCLHSLTASEGNTGDVGVHDFEMYLHNTIIGPLSPHDGFVQQFSSLRMLMKLCFSPSVLELRTISWQDCGLSPVSWLPVGRALAAWK